MRPLYYNLTIGTLTAKEAKEAIHRKIWRRSLNSVVNNICKSVVPVLGIFSLIHKGATFFLII